MMGGCIRCVSMMMTVLTVPRIDGGGAVKSLATVAIVLERWDEGWVALMHIARRDDGGIGGTIESSRPEFMIVEATPSPTERVRLWGIAACSVVVVVAVGFVVVGWKPGFGPLPVEVVIYPHQPHFRFHCHCQCR